MNNLTQFANNKLAFNYYIHSQVNMFVFDAHVLGDGCIQNVDPSKNKHYLFSFCSKYRTYIEWISSHLIILEGRTIRRKSYFDKRTNKPYESWWVRSLSSQFLTNQYKRWYPNGIKTIPDDINVNAEFLLHFYLDDGSRASNGAYYFALDSQPTNKVELLRDKIEAYTGFKVSIHRNGNGYRLYIPKRYDFLGLIGNCPVAEFDYKWRN